MNLTGGNEEYKPDDGFTLTPLLPENSETVYKMRDIGRNRRSYRARVRTFGPAAGC